MKAKLTIMKKIISQVDLDKMAATMTPLIFFVAIPFMQKILTFYVEIKII
mgnify:CR=1 FL=1